MKSTFVRKGGKSKQPTGKEDASGGGVVKDLPLACYPSSLNSSLLFTSLGLHELDDLVGGGGLVGGVVGVEQDQLRHYKSVARFFVSQGQACGHGVAVVGARDSDPEAFLRSDVALSVKSLPKEPVVSSQVPLSVDGVKIAWRYKAQLLEKTSLSGSDTHKTLRRCDLFDLSKNVPPERAHAVLHRPGGLKETYEAIERLAQQYNAGIQDASLRSPPILRVLLLNFGSGLWQEEGPFALVQFLWKLRQLVRQSLCVAMVCVGPTATNTAAYQHCFDQSFVLDSFEGESPSFPGFHGTLTLRRTVSLFSAAPWEPDCRQYLFRRTRRTFQIERLYMPPEDRAVSNLACATTGGSGNSDLDF